MTFTSWSPSRLADYQQCPAMARWKHLERLCPQCFKGKLSGGFDGVPTTCDTCQQTITKSPALERGSTIDAAMEKYLTGGAPVMPLEVIALPSRKIANDVRKAVKAGKGKIQLQITLDRNWQPTKWFAPNAWLRVKMDAILFQPHNTVKVIDWKTGGIDKRTGAPYENPKYDQQLSIYTVTALSSLSSVTTATAALVFLDAAEEPVVEREAATLKRADLAKAQEEWNRRIVPMMNDDVFAPCPSHKCSWCDYASKKGGPCQF